MTWNQYRRTNLAEMRPYVPGESLDGVSVSAVDTPALGGMIARNPENHADQWYVARAYFEANFEPIHASDCALHNEPAMAAGMCDCGGEAA